jgi:glycosyltransferase involved in cell wall biosynthesis
MINFMRDSITVVVPTFNEEVGLKKCFEALNVLTDEILKIGVDKVSVVFSDNRSVDQSWEMLSEACNNNAEWSAIQLDRNYGLQASLLKAMSVIKSDAILIFQSDLQDPIYTAVEMVRSWHLGADVVVGIAKNHTENFFNSLGRKFFYQILTKTSDFSLHSWVQDFYVLDKRVYTRLFRQGYTHQFIRGRLSEEFGVDHFVSYKRLQRNGGSSSFNFASKYSLALDGVLRHGSRIARWLNLSSLFISISSLFAIIGIILSWLLGYRVPIQGWMSLMTLNLIILASIGFMMGFTFEFLFRILRTVESKDAPVIFQSTNKDLT